LATANQLEKRQQTNWEKS